MPTDWTQLVVAFLSGGSIFGLLGYFGRRWLEQHPRSESLARDHLTVDLVAKVVDLMSKAKDADLQVGLRLENLVQPARSFHDSTEVAIQLRSGVLWFSFLHAFSLDAAANRLPDYRSFAELEKQTFKDIYKYLSGAMQHCEMHGWAEVVHAYHAFIETPTDVTRTALDDALTRGAKQAIAKSDTGATPS